jgi:hypothetical protein
VGSGKPQVTAAEFQAFDVDLRLRRPEIEKRREIVAAMPPEVPLRVALEPVDAGAFVAAHPKVIAGQSNGGEIPAHPSKLRL